MLKACPCSCLFSARNSISSQSKFLFEELCTVVISTTVKSSLARLGPGYDGCSGTINNANFSKPFQFREYINTVFTLLSPKVSNRDSGELAFNNLWEVDLLSPLSHGSQLLYLNFAGQSRQLQLQLIPAKGLDSCFSTHLGLSSSSLTTSDYFYMLNILAIYYQSRLRSMSPHPQP